MFTGLVEALGNITSIEKTSNGMRLSMKPSTDMEVRIGDSIAVNGVCLTATTDKKDIIFDVSPETMQSTNLGGLKVNQKVNLERALRLSDRLGGHMVTGHVDAAGKIREKKREGEYTFYTFEAPSEILRYIVKKGSVAIDGISLTVTGLDSRSFSVAIIPHTLTATNIGGKDKGDTVNIEIDIIGKYVEKFLLNADNKKDFGELLREKGFTG
ncbi:MAG: riboflavin synthase [Thermodesulfovibrionia bacterium]|nr:riboflavin synthase [Thermodesulfovibrionia bacterium]